MNFETSVLSYFGDLKDPRTDKNLTHPLTNIVSIAILATICGADDGVVVETYDNAKQEWLATFLDLSKGNPFHDTSGRVFRWLDEDAFQLKFTGLAAQICEATAGEIVAIDGKKLRRSGDSRHARDGIWMVSTWVSENRMVLDKEKWMRNRMKSLPSPNCSPGLMCQVVL